MEGSPGRPGYGMSSGGGPDRVEREYHSGKWASGEGSAFGKIRRVAHGYDKFAGRSSTAALLVVRDLRSWYRGMESLGNGCDRAQSFGAAGCEKRWVYDLSETVPGTLVPGAVVT